LSAPGELLDANVWLALIHAAHPHHTVAQRVWTGFRRPVFCRQTQMALVRLLCNRHVMESDILSLSGAWAKYDWLYANAYCDYVNEPVGFETAFRYYAQSNFPSIQRLGDAYLAAFALTAELTLVTFDKGFRQFKGLDCKVLKPVKPAP
jgi:toxin-antitoxin system PIN domain toxin